MKHYFKITSIGMATALLSGCLHAPLKANLAPQQAVAQAYQYLYDHPSYRFNGQLRLKRLTLPADPVLSKSLTKDPQLIQKMLQAYSQRYQFNYSGVMDLPNYKISLTPEIRYEAVNMSGYIRVPMLLDLKNSDLYSDLSAFSPWLVPAANDGKYTRFDGSRYKNRVDLKKLYQLMQQTTQAGYIWPDARDFKELPLSAQERQQGATRKIQFSTALNPHIARLGTFLSLNEAMIKQAVIKPELMNQGLMSQDLADAVDPAKNKTGPSPAVLIDAQQAYAKMQADSSGSSNAYNSLLQGLERKLDSRSRLNQVILLNAQGRLIQSEVLYSVYIKGAKQAKAELELSHQWQVSDYGSAKAPAVGQWVDAKQNMQDSLLGGVWAAIKSKRATSLDDSEDSDKQANKEAEKDAEKETEKNSSKDSPQKDEIDESSDNDKIENDMLDNTESSQPKLSQTVKPSLYALPFAADNTISINHPSASNAVAEVSSSAQASDAQALLQRGTTVALQQMQAKASDQQVFVNTFVAMALQQRQLQSSPQSDAETQLRQKALKLYAAEPAPDLSQPVDSSAQPTLIYQAIQAAYRINKQCAGMKQVTLCQQQQLKQLKPIE